MMQRNVAANVILKLLNLLIDLVNSIPVKAFDLAHNISLLDSSPPQFLRLRQQLSDIVSHNGQLLFVIFDTLNYLIISLKV